MNNIQKEIELLKQMIKFNTELVNSFEESVKKQQNTINIMMEQKMSKAHIKVLESHLSENKMKLDHLKSTIMNSQIPKIKSIIRSLEPHA